MLTSAVALLYLALFALAIAQPQHGDALSGRRLFIARGRQASRVGWLLLTVSFGFAMLSPHPVIATLIWIGAVPAVGLPIVLARTYQPALARAFVVIAAIVAISPLILSIG